MPDKEDSKTKKVDDELRDEQEKVVKNLLSEMGLTDKEVDTILTPTGEPGTPKPVAPQPSRGEEAVPSPSVREAGQAPRPMPSKPVSEESAEEELVAPSPGIETLFKKLDEMANTVSALERGIAASLSTQLLEFRRELVEVRTEIARKLTERLRMKAFQPMVENAISEVVVAEVKKLEENLLESFSKELIGRFRGFREELTSSKYRLLSAIKEQADIYGAHGKSLEDELTLRERQIRELKEEVAKNDAIVKEQRSSMSELQADVARLEGELKEAAGSPKASMMELNDLRARVQTQQTTIERLRSQVIESTELKARLKAYEDDVEEKRRRIEEQNVRMMDLEGKFAEAEVKAQDLERVNKSIKTEVEKLRADSTDVMKAKSRAMELQASYDRMKQEVQDLRSIVDETEDKLQQKKAEVARVLKVMAKEPKYKILTILKDLGTLNFNEIARAIGQPVAIAKRYSQELQQDGYVRIDDSNNVTGVDEWAKTAKSSG